MNVTEHNRLQAETAMLKKAAINRNSKIVDNVISTLNEAINEAINKK